MNKSSISGFTIVKNADKYYFPIRESILSILPVVDEFIVAMGDNDADDRTEEIIASINSPKLKIFRRDWDKQLYVDGEILRSETNYALSKCSGDWCFYLQGDEAVHEKYLSSIRNACDKYLHDNRVEGFLFNYRHFWGDYDHYTDSHGWYPREMRIVRNNCGVYSIKDAQSFRIRDNEKLNVIHIPAYVYHYGWVRPPRVMTSKKKEQDSMYWGIKKAQDVYKHKDYFDYGPLGRLPVFKETHPAVMKDWIAYHHWKDKLNYGKKLDVNRKLFKHEMLKYRIISFIEKYVLGGRQIGGYKNWKVVGKEK